MVSFLPTHESTTLVVTIPHFTERSHFGLFDDMCFITIRQNVQIKYVNYVRIFTCYLDLSPLFVLYKCTIEAPPSCRCRN